MSAPLDLHSVGRLPASGDNVAIAVRTLAAGTVIELDGTTRTLAHTVLEGHRFAVRAIAPEEPLLSWGLPFGHALVHLAPGDYVCNRSMLEALAIRQTDARLPAQPNFADHLAPFQLDESAFRPGAPVDRSTARRTFAGYRRPGQRCVGTRNYIVILGTTSRAASFARQLASRLRPLARVHPALDGIVAVAHTEGGDPGEPNNVTEVLRALAGFMVHPNVGAVLAVDYGVEPVDNQRLRTFLQEHGYPLADVPHHFLSIRRGLAAALAEGEAIVRGWLPAVAAARRTPEPLSGLRVALQCGGSDAFSGVSGNPLAGAIVHEVVRHGGIGVLTETDEVIGGEAYLLRNIRDFATARRLLAKIENFRHRLACHGSTPEGNPSAGNKFRGLYNISLKSLGAVHKKDPRTRLEFVTNYAEPLGAPGFYFMNGPGNDLEGIAGQVGTGCNLLLFVTGNGSITNFPFVPTLKITTTTRRHELLVHEMDINAGRYLDGESMDALAAEAFELVIATASGRTTQGEHAGHSQVSLWRNWRQTDTTRVAEIRARPTPDGQPLLVGCDRAECASLGGWARRQNEEANAVQLFRTATGWATERLGLVLPVSLCSAQIARLAAERLNACGLGRACGISRFVALPHSEGCGFSGATLYALLQRTYQGYVTHPNVAAALLLEHGCEKVPNDAMRRQFEAAAIPLDRFGWSNVQLEGGIESSLANIEAWFATRLATLPPAARAPAGLGALAVGMQSAPDAAGAAATAFTGIAAAVLAAGGSVLLPEGDPLLAHAAFRDPLLGATLPHATLAYGQPLSAPGLHVVATETDHWVENLAGLGGCGVHLFLTAIGSASEQGHPMLPVVQVAAPGARGRIDPADVDGFLSDDAAADEAMLRRLLVITAQGDYAPAATRGGFTDFQITRGLLGVTT
jgi:altronate dehydratase